MRILANQPLDVIWQLQNNRRGQSDRCARIHEQPRHVLLAVERRLIERGQTRGIFEIEVSPGLDQRGKRGSLPLDDRKVQRCATMIRAIHSLIEIDGRIGQLTDNIHLAHRDG
jgi:hypothetical protein